MADRLEALAMTWSVRTRRAAESYRSAAEAIGDIVPGASMFSLTRGQWSMIDAAMHCIQQAGPSRISVWTWVVAEYEVECLERLAKASQVTAARLICDVGMRNKSKAGPGILDYWRTAFGADSVRLCSNHGKIVTIESDRYRLLLRGSMNLNYNPRFEQFDLSEGGPEFDLVREVEDSLPVLHPLANRAEANVATGVDRAFDSRTLAMFSGAKPWMP